MNPKSAAERKEKLHADLLHHGDGDYRCCCDPVHVLFQTSSTPTAREFSPDAGDSEHHSNRNGKLSHSHRDSGTDSDAERGGNRLATPAVTIPVAGQATMIPIGTPTERLNRSAFRSRVNWERWFAGIRITKIWSLFLMVIS